MRKFIDMVEAISVQTHDFDRAPGSFEKDDIALRNNPKGVKKIEKRWETSQADVKLVLVNIPQIDGASALAQTQGEKSREPWIKYLQEKVPVSGTPGVITVVLSNNSGDGKMPLTAWMVGHRMWHAMGYGRGMETMWAHTATILYEALDMILHLYRASPRMSQLPWRQDAAALLGRSRACRERLLTRDTEILPEWFAEYMLMGRVKLNRELPETLHGKPFQDVTDERVARVFGSRERLMKLIDDLEESANRMCAYMVERGKGEVFYL